eukprot:269771_1
MLLIPDWEILGFVVSGHVSCVMVTICLIYFIKNIQKKENTPNTLKYSTIMTFVLSILYGFIIGFFRTNLFFPHINFTPHQWPCKLTVLLSCVFYTGSRLSMYAFFTYKIEFVFQNSDYGVSPVFMHRIRISSCIVTLSLFVLLFTSIQTCGVVTPHLNILLCTVDVSSDLTISNIALMLFFLFDTIISLSCVWIYCYKLHQMSQRMRQLMQYNLNLANAENMMLLAQIQSKLMKAVILVCTCVLSTWFFAVIGSFVWWTVGWFLPLDVLINSLSLCLMYNFPVTSKAYECGCMPCISLCKYYFQANRKTIMVSSPSTSTVSSTPKKQAKHESNMTVEIAISVENIQQKEKHNAVPNEVTFTL